MEPPRAAVLLSFHICLSVCVCVEILLVPSSHFQVTLLDRSVVYHCRWLYCVRLRNRPELTDEERHSQKIGRPKCEKILRRTIDRNISFVAAAVCDIITCMTDFG